MSCLSKYGASDCPGRGNVPIYCGIGIKEAEEQLAIIIKKDKRDDEKTKHDDDEEKEREDGKVVDVRR